MRIAMRSGSRPFSGGSCGIFRRLECEDAFSPVLDCIGREPALSVDLRASGILEMFAHQAGSFYKILRLNRGENGQMLFCLGAPWRTRPSLPILYQAAEFIKALNCLQRKSIARPFCDSFMEVAVCFK